jgi:hypothetical protein
MAIFRAAARASLSDSLGVRYAVYDPFALANLPATFTAVR